MMLDNDKTGIEVGQKKGEHCAHMGYNMLLDLLRKHNDRKDELIANQKLI